MTWSRRSTSCKQTANTRAAAVRAEVWELASARNHLQLHQTRSWGDWLWLHAPRLVKTVCLWCVQG